MKFLTFPISLAVAFLLNGAIASAQDGGELPDDQLVTVNGINVACTGVGDEARNDPQWREFPVRIEFAGGEAQYLSDLDITLADARGNELVQARCNTPWFLADVPPGKYTVRASFDGMTETARFNAPAQGQARVIVRFPSVVGDN